MPGLSALGRMRKYGSTPQGGAPNYYDLPGAGMLPGGALKASPSMSGTQRTLSGIDLPFPMGDAPAFTPNTTGLDYSNTLGLPPKEGGGAGGPGGPRNIGQNIPPNEDISPYDPNNDFYYSGSPDMNAQPASDWVTDGTNAGYHPQYPMPGGGQGGPTAGNWASNASRPTAPWGFGPNYVDPQQAFFDSLGLANWNAGGWSANPTGGEPGINVLGRGPTTAKGLARASFLRNGSAGMMPGRQK